MKERELAHHAARVEAAIASGQAAKSAVVASWRRSSRLHQLDPAGTRPPLRLTDAELLQIRQRVEPLLRAARPAMDRLYQAVGGSGCCVLLADRDGVPVDRRGAAADDLTFESWGLWTGAIWSEEHEGTNGIGTCLVEQRGLHRRSDLRSRSKTCWRARHLFLSGRSNRRLRRPDCACRRRCGAAYRSGSVPRGFCHGPDRVDAFDRRPRRRVARRRCR
jgi:hypothetical protein